MAESPGGTIWLDTDTGDRLIPIAQNAPAASPGPSRGGPVFDSDGTLWWNSADGLRRIAHPEHPKIGAAIRVEDVADAYSDTDGLTSELAVRYMLDTDAPLTDIAVQCGFADQAHLCGRFRDAIGESPATWRRARRAQYDSSALVASSSSFKGASAGISLTDRVYRPTGDARRRV